MTFSKMQTLQKESESRLRLNFIEMPGIRFAKIDTALLAPKHAWGFFIWSRT
jgi:hypothetical protein